MASSLQRKADADLRRVTEDEAVVLPEGAPPDDSPTVISKTPPILEPISSTKQKVTDLGRSPLRVEALIAGLADKRLAHFELIEKIGEGGMAAVIRARDTQLDRPVALKLLPPEMAAEPENVERFHQEARAAAKLDHENIARVYYCGEDQGLHFIAFEFVEGINLRTMLEKRGRLPVAEAVRYILQVAAGLEHATTRGVVHRDVKPSNIIITPAGRAKLVDMGLARNLERRGERDLTQSGMTLGTFDYISPEQALEPREADARSDIYSLGCTFYHLLTGLPPVPEGTPAKKLHHHQHLAPVDPRQIDPSIPDEIVMILGKMMAKNPRDRYQRPIHLVHHLMQIAQKVGAANDVPEGVLFVETPLPGQLPVRPVVAIGIALAALIVVTLVLSLISDPAPPSPRPGPPINDGKGTQPIADQNPQTPKKEATPQARQSVAHDFETLDNILTANPSPDINARIDGTIELNKGLTFKGIKGQRLTIETDDVDRSRIDFHYAGPTSLFGLLVDGGKEVVFRNIRFHLNAKVTPAKVAAAVAVRGVETVKFQQCIFAQVDVPRLTSKPGAIASVFIDSPATMDGPIPTIILDQCLFDSLPTSGGHAAIAINGPANVQVKNCAFKPHGSLFQFRKDCTAENTSVQLTNCSAFVLYGPAFRFAPRASAKVRSDASVYSRPGSQLAMPPSDGLLPQPGLIYLGDTWATLQYQGESNLYHNLNAFVERPSKEFSEKKEPLIAKLEAFQDFLVRNKGNDKNAVVLDDKTDPWHQPEAIKRAVTDVHAFQLKTDYHDKFGLKKSWLGESMPVPLLAKLPPPNGRPKVKIVDADDKTTPGVLADVAQALIGAQDGDVILIKHPEGKREVVVSPVDLKPNVSVTLKPFEGHQPILVLNKDYKHKDSALFKVHSGKLQIENMEVQLDPAPAAFEMQSIVHLGESAHCVFKNCVLTLRSTGSVPLNVATFVDLTGMMKMESALSSPRVEFHECFIRGKGDLVSLRGCRLLQVDMQSSLVALEGSILDIEPGNKAMPMSQGVRWKIERSSIYTTEPVIALHARTSKGLTETQADVRGCLFVSLAPKQPVVSLEIDDMLEKYLKWRGEQNFYANYDKDKMRDWKETFPETGAEFGSVNFPDLKEEMIQRLWNVTPEALRPSETDMESLAEFGVPAAVEKRLLPTPPPEPEE